ncbi:MAG: VOC family protein [Acidobacteria bacterium]|nr:VOC family protein [Acidobacteriota bacterium]
MKIEHVAYQVPDPVALADWYVEHLGLRIKRATDGPGHARFLADDTDAVMVEVYNNPRVTMPDYRAIDPLMLHLAFRADDVAATRERLLAAGATPEGEVVVSEGGDHLAMLRDPWGLAIQLVRRRDPMIP